VEKFQRCCSCTCRVAHFLLYLSILEGNRKCGGYDHPANAEYSVHMSICPWFLCRIYLILDSILRPFAHSTCRDTDSESFSFFSPLPSPEYGGRSAPFPLVVGSYHSNHLLPPPATLASSVYSFFTSTRLRQLRQVSSLCLSTLLGTAYEVLLVSFLSLSTEYCVVIC
jgi:hypothetical protein